MKKFIPISEKIGPEDDVDVTVAILHTFSYLDDAALIARKNDDAELLLDVFKASLKATDRLTGIAFHMNEGEEYERPIDNTDTSGGFGFQAPQGECIPVEEDE